MKIENRDTLALLARKIPVEMHAHHAVQLVVSLNESYPANLGGEEFAAVRGFLIDRDVPHACRSENADLLVTSVDAETDKGKCLRRILGDNKFRLIEDVLPVKTIEDFSVSFRKNENFDHSALLAMLVENGGAAALKSDSRIVQAIDFIGDNIETDFRISGIAASVHLSESRLRHLFRERVGISISSYVLWTRMKLALREMLAGKTSLADAAHAAGFSDHAHFTRNFRRMFGVPPSLLVKYTEVLEVFDL